MGKKHHVKYRNHLSHRAKQDKYFDSVIITSHILFDSLAWSSYKDESTKNNNYNVTCAS